jgi:hypothetical protein
MVGAHQRRLMGRRKSAEAAVMATSPAEVTARLMHRPIYGGVFGQGRYTLASMPCVSRGLYATRYMVVEPKAGAVLSVAEDKVEALADARRALHAANDANAAVEHQPHQLELGLLEPEERGPDIPPRLLPKPISRRRQEIFSKSDGRCHYCDGILQLDGKWHVEHMMPRALGGGDDPLNLVAACVGCNLEKSDRTALEFHVRRNAM